MLTAVKRFAETACLDADPRKSFVQRLDPHRSEIACLPTPRRADARHRVDPRPIRNPHRILDTPWGARQIRKGGLKGFGLG